MKIGNSVFNTSVYELGMGGPAGKHLKYFISFKGNFTDEFTKNPADQLYSSIYPGSTFFSPITRQSLGGSTQFELPIQTRHQFKFFLPAFHHHQSEQEHVEDNWQ